jgi:hypothetical protein
VQGAKGCILSTTTPAAEQATGVGITSSDAKLLRSVLHCLHWAVLLHWL